MYYVVKYEGGEVERCGGKKTEKTLLIWKKKKRGKKETKDKLKTKGKKEKRRKHWGFGQVLGASKTSAFGPCPFFENSNAVLFCISYSYPFQKRWGDVQ